MNMMMTEIQGMWLMTEPYKLLENAEINIFERDAPDGKVKITDDGWTVDYLEGRGIYLKYDHDKARQVVRILKARNVETKDNEIFVITTPQYKWEAKDKVELAIAAILTTIIDDENYRSFEVE